MTEARPSPLSPAEQKRAADIALDGLAAACEYFLAVCAMRRYLGERMEEDFRRRERTGEGFSPLPLGEDFDGLHYRGEVAVQGMTLAASRAADLMRDLPVVARDNWFSEISGTIGRVTKEARAVAAGVNEALGGNGTGGE